MHVPRAGLDPPDRETRRAAPGIPSAPRRSTRRRDRSRRSSPRPARGSRPAARRSSIGPIRTPGERLDVVGRDELVRQRRDPVEPPRWFATSTALAPASAIRTRLVPSAVTSKGFELISPPSGFTIRSNLPRPTRKWGFPWSTLIELPAGDGPHPPGLHRSDVGDARQVDDELPLATLEVGRSPRRRRRRTGHPRVRPPARRPVPRTRTERPRTRTERTRLSSPRSSAGRPLCGVVIDASCPNPSRCSPTCSSLCIRVRDGASTCVSRR